MNDKDPVRRVTRNGSDGFRIALPTRLVREFRVSVGDYLAFTLSSDREELKMKKAPPPVRRQRTPRRSRGGGLPGDEFEWEGDF